MYQRSEAAFAIDRLTIVRSSAALFAIAASSDEPKTTGYSIGATITSSVFLQGETGIALSPSPYNGAVTHRFNNVFAATTPYWNVSVTWADDGGLWKTLIGI